MTFSIERAAIEGPHRVALVHENRSWTFAELAREVRAKRSRAAARDELTPFVAHAHFDTLLSVYAMLETRAPFLSLHSKLTEIERTALIADARISLDKNRQSGGLLAVLYTSGTTGKSRGAALSRAAFEASARASAKNLPRKEDDRWLLCMPLSHVGGLSIVTRSLAARTGVVFQPRFDVDAVLTSVVRDRVTRISVVPTMLFDLLNRDRHNVLANVETVLVGGAATSPALLLECAARRVRALTTYGLTEACSQVTTQAPRDPSEVETGSGHPLAGIEVAIVDPAGAPMKQGEIGSISVRGPQLMEGYLGEEPLAGRAFDTGDLGAIDERGNLHIASRRHDLIVTGGENVYPIEVEDALSTCTGVRGAVVFGVDDERWGQQVCAAIAVDQDFDEHRVLAQLSEKLASFKRPKHLTTTTALPLAANGKVLRAETIRAFTPTLRPWRNP